MADFSPLKDYFGLNALVSRFVALPDDSTHCMSSTARASAPSGQFHEVIEVPPQAQRRRNDDDIIRLSKVYRERWNNVRRRRKPLNHCVFCKNNGESETVYSSHTLKDQEQKIVCPILRAYTCPICGASGDGAHTIKYCPFRVQMPTVN